MLNPRVVIVDHDRATRTELIRMLAPGRIVVAGEADHGAEAPAVAAEIQPDLVLLRLEEPIARGLRSIEAVTTAAPRAAIIVYSSSARPALIRRAMVAGAMDYLGLPLREDRVLEAAVGVLRRARSKESDARSADADASARGQVITVFGAKGGIGKTTIATNLAVALGRDCHQSVALVDLDTRFGDGAFMMGLEAGGSIVDLLRNGEPVDRNMIRRSMTHHPAGISILPACRHPSQWGLVTPEQVRGVVWELARSHDFVVIDTPGAFSDLVGESIQLATSLLLVTSTDRASIKNTGMMWSLLQSHAISMEKVRVIVNHCLPRSKVPVAVPDLEVGWTLPFCKRVALSTQLGEPVVLSDPSSAFARSIIAAARSMSGDPYIDSPPRGWRLSARNWPQAMCIGRPRALHELRPQ